MLFFNIVQAIVVVGNKILIKKDGGYLTLNAANKTASIGSKEMSPVLTANHHVRNGFYFTNKGTNVLVYDHVNESLMMDVVNLTEKETQFHVIKLSGDKYHIKNGFNKCATLNTNNHIKFNECQQTNKDQLFDIEIVRDDVVDTQ